MNDKIKKAFDEIRKYHPTVTTVVFNKYGQWNYCDDNFNAPVFSDKIDVTILEDASDSVEWLPRVISFDDEEADTYTKEDLLAVMNLGMVLRQAQLNGSDLRSGNDVLKEWIENKSK
jgi:hypothetical protein